MVDRKIPQSTIYGLRSTLLYRLQSCGVGELDTSGGSPLSGVLHSRVRCDSHASVFGKCVSTSARTRECTASASARTRECSTSASTITRECTATTRLGGREQRARGSEKRARGRLGGREQRARVSEKIARGRLREKHGGSEKRTRIPEQRVQRSETESAEARRARAKQRNLGG